MDKQHYDINDTEVQMTLVMKLQQLQRESRTYLTYQNLEEYTMNNLWNHHNPKSLYRAVDDIMRIQANDVVKYLARKTIMNSDEVTLADFTDLIGGN